MKESFDKMPPCRCGISGRWAHPVGFGKCSIRLEEHPDEGLWIAEDSRRQGCWASGRNPAAAMTALKSVQADYDETFGVAE